LELSEKARFRFAHIDGGHERDEVLHDLRLCASHMLRWTTTLIPITSV
jgi:hypothetical protein